jgi:hypothetical protein
VWIWEPGDDSWDAPGRLVVLSVTVPGTLAQRLKVTIPGMDSGDRSWERMRAPFCLMV